MDNNIIFLYSRSTLRNICFLSHWPLLYTYTYSINSHTCRYLPRLYFVDLIKFSSNTDKSHDNKPTYQGFCKYLTRLTRYGWHEWLKQLLVSSRVLLKHRHSRFVTCGSFVLHHSRECLETINILSCITTYNTEFQHFE